MDQIFAGTNVKYSVLEKKIILSTEIVQGIQQEQNKVTGIVKDANGEPIIGANVIVKGQSTGTITDIDGRFVPGYSQRCRFTDYLYRVCFSRSESFERKNLMLY